MPRPDLAALRLSVLLSVLTSGKHKGRFDTTGIASAERWDPVTNAWTAVTNMSHGRYLATAVTLLDGSILVTGGRNERGSGTWSAERYSAKEDEWTPFANMTAKRMKREKKRGWGTALWP